MGGVILTLYGFEHRVSQDHQMESRPAGGKKDGWAIRAPHEVKLDESQYWEIRQALKDLSFKFPAGMQPNFTAPAEEVAEPGIAGFDVK